ncbi:MAG: 3-dehydroquinate synthase [Chloroflexota bacterium]|nr:3-dehydroquinate synthase [Chloroflexota bacterium]
MASRIDVKSPEGTYPILIERRALGALDSHATVLGLERRVGVITNTTLAPLYGEALCAALPDAKLITMPDGEQFKNLDTMRSLYAQMVAARLDRSSTVIALGGGVVGDTAGFAAASYMRGVRLIQVPTSLLAMVDSSVGGKVGVDLPQGKNLVGAFKQPEAVIIDTEVLRTLPARERRCGMAEIIKHALIADPDLLELAAQASVPSALDDRLVQRAVQVKVQLVQQDPFEKGIRAHLNLGHTFGHAFEQVSGYRIPHGEGVAIGLVAAARLSHRLGMCGAEVVDRVEQVVGEAGLPAFLEDLDPEAVWAAMGTDKKWQSGTARFVLLRGLGQPEIVEGVAKGDVLTILESLR